MSKLTLIIFTAFSIPLKKEKKEFLIPIRTISNNFSIKMDIDFYLYSIFIVTLIVSLFVASFISLSQIMGIEIFRYSSENLHIISNFSIIMGPVGFLLFVVFYITKRIKIDLKNSVFPIVSNPQILIDKNKSGWIKWGAVMVVLSLILIFGSHFLPIGLINHFGWENNIFLVHLMLFLPIFVIPFGTMLLIYALLILEKIIRFFSQTKHDFSKIK